MHETGMILINFPIILIGSQTIKGQVKPDNNGFAVVPFNDSFNLSNQATIH